MLALMVYCTKPATKLLEIQKQLACRSQFPQQTQRSNPTSPLKTPFDETAGISAGFIRDVKRD